MLCLVSHVWLCDRLDCSPPGSSVESSVESSLRIHGDSPGKNTAVGCQALLQGSSKPRDGTQVSPIAGGFFTVWGIRVAHEYWSG